MAEEKKRALETERELRVREKDKRDSKLYVEIVFHERGGNRIRHGEKMAKNC